MSEIKSRQAALVAAGKKTTPPVSGGKRRVAVFGTPDTHAAAQDDTLVAGFPLPAGIRFTADSIVSHAAMGSNVTLSVGIRDFKTKEVLFATAIADGVAVASAGRTALNNGSKVAAGVDYVTTVVTELYATLGGGNPTENAQLRIEVGYISID